MESPPSPPHLLQSFLTPFLLSHSAFNLLANFVVSTFITCSESNFLSCHLQGHQLSCFGLWQESPLPRLTASTFASQHGSAVSLPCQISSLFYSRTPTAAEGKRKSRSRPTDPTRWGPLLEPLWAHLPPLSQLHTVLWTPCPQSPSTDHCLHVKCSSYKATP